MQQELLQQMGPAFLALAIAAFLAAVAFWVRKGLVQKETRQERATREREQTHRQVDRRMASVHQPSKRTPIDATAVATVIEGFEAQALLDRARDLFRTVQQTRLAPDREVLEQDLLPGALDVALAAGQGLEAVGRTWVSPARFERLGGTADGCEATIRLRALVEETRGGQVGLVEIEESWTFGWPPARQSWRVMRVQRHWRRPLEAPRLVENARTPAEKPVRATGLDDQEDLDADGVSAAAELVVPAWAEALGDGRPELLEGLVEPAFVEHIEGRVEHLERFGVRFAQQIDVEQVELARQLSGGGSTWATAWVYGTERITLAPDEPKADGSADDDAAEAEAKDSDGAATGAATTVSRPWARYLTFRHAGEGQWILAWTEREDDWVV